MERGIFIWWRCILFVSEILGYINVIYDKKMWIGGMNEDFIVCGWDLKIWELIGRNIRGI